MWRQHRSRSRTIGGWPTVESGLTLDPDLSTALTAIREAIAGVDVDLSTLPAAVQRFFQAGAERARFSILCGGDADSGLRVPVIPAPSRTVPKA